MICQPPATSTDTSRRSSKTTKLFDIKLIWRKMQFCRKSLNLLLSNQFIYRERTLSSSTSRSDAESKTNNARARARERVFWKWLLVGATTTCGSFLRHKPRQNTFSCCDWGGCCCCTSYLSLSLSLPPQRHLLVMVTEHGDGRSRTKLR